MHGFSDQHALIMRDYFDHASVSLNIVHCSCGAVAVLSTDILFMILNIHDCTLEIGRRLENGHELFLEFSLSAPNVHRLYPLVIHKL